MTTLGLMLVGNSRNSLPTTWLDIHDLTAVNLLILLRNFVFFYNANLDKFGNF